MTDPVRRSARQSPTRARASGLELVVASVAWMLAVAGCLVLIPPWLSAALASGATDRSTLVSVVMLVPVFAWLASLGWLLVRLRPGHRVGWLFLVAALLGVGVFLSFAIAGYGSDAAPVLAGAASTIGAVLLVVFLTTLLGFLPLLFPDGQLPGPRWRLPTRAIVGSLLVATPAIILGLHDTGPGSPANPFAIPWLPTWIGPAGMAVATATMIASTLVGIASVGVRFRRGHGDERQQVKWLLAAIVLVTVATLPTFFGITSDLLNLLGPVALALVPASVTLAILRYRLYEIDRLISRTIAWALVTVALVAAFVVGNLALQAVLVNVTSGQTLAVAASTLIAFAAFQPLRRRIQEAVDRRFDRARVDAAVTVAAFSARQRGAVDLGSVVDDIRATARGAMRPTAVGIWLRDAAGSPRVVARSRDRG